MRVEFIDKESTLLGLQLACSYVIYTREGDTAGYFFFFVGGCYITTTDLQSNAEDGKPGLHCNVASMDGNALMHVLSSMLHQVTRGGRETDC
jgi:hypothetical protein